MRRQAATTAAILALAVALAATGVACSSSGGGATPGLPDASADTATGNGGGQDTTSPFGHDVGPKADAGPTVDAGSTDTGGPQPPCAVDADCANAFSAEQLGPCHVAACDPAQGCIMMNRPEGTACDDGNACTTQESCLAGNCVGMLVNCDDGNPCTDETCDAKQGCVYTNNDKPCDDGIFCTVSDRCADGECSGQPNPACQCDTDDDCASIDDGDKCNGVLVCKEHQCVTSPGSVVQCDPSLGGPCKVVACEPSSGVCKAAPVADGESCDDGDACTVNDACAAGQCKGTVLDCDDGNACTDDACDPQQGCTHAPNDAACDDGDLCTTDDHCQDGACTGSPNPECQCETDADCAAFENGNLCDGTLVCLAGKCVIDPATVVACTPGASNPCRTTQCEPATGQCIEKNALDGTPCGDADACSTPVCQGGQCVEPPPPDCDDGNPCTDDTCDPQQGCIHTPNTAPCDDGDTCTLDDQCAGGACSGTPDPACQCDTDADCAAYEDGDKCNGTLSCVDHQCVLNPATVVTCDATGLGPCYVAACDPATGVCSNQPLDDGTACDDGNACTLDDTCLGGECVGTALVCDDGNVCTSDACDPAVGCTHSFNANPCDDGNACTENDQCDNGTCVGTALPECQCDVDADCAAFEDDDLCNGTLICAGHKCVIDPATVVTCPPSDDLCSMNTCDPDTGTCVPLHQPDGKPCDDGNACTGGEFCLQGTCTGGLPVACDDGNPCTDDTCDPASGCQFVPNSAPCDDGDPCTGGDVCDGGVCQPGGENLCPDTCSPAWTLSCGQTDAWSLAKPGTTDAVDAYACSPFDYSGPEYTYRFTAPYDGTLHVVLSDETSETDLLVLENTGGSCDATQCATWDYSSVDQPMSAGQEYFLVVDGFAGATGDYTISVTCTPSHEQVCDDGVDDDEDGLTDCDDTEDCLGTPACPVPECSPAFVLNCGDTDTWANYNPGSTNVIASYTGCGDPYDYGDAPEYAYTFTAPVDGTVTVTLSNESAETDIIVIDGGSGDTCDPAMCVAWELSSASFEAVAGHTYYFVVDGYAGAQGTYEISVTCPASETDCSNGIDDDSDGATDCDDSDCAGATACVGPCTPPVTTTLGCGETTSGTNSGPQSTDLVDSYACNLTDTYPAPERAFLFTAPYDGTLTAALTDETAETDVLIVEAAGGLCSPDQCVAWDYSNASTHVVAGQDYWVIVDGYGGDVGSWTLSLDCVADAEVSCTDGIDEDQDGVTDCADPDCFGASPDCQPACQPAAQALTCGSTLSASNGAAGSTTAIETYGCSPWNYTGPEMAWPLTVDAPATVTVSLANEAADTDIVVLSDAGLGCNPVSCLTWGYSAATFDAVPGTTYYVVVDGYNGATGSFDLTVSCTP